VDVAEASPPSRDGEDAAVTPRRRGRRRYTPTAGRRRHTPTAGRRRHTPTAGRRRYIVSAITERKVL